LQGQSGKKIIRANLINPVSDNQADLLHNAVLVLAPATNNDKDPEYQIELIGREEEFGEYLKPESGDEIIDLREYILIPALLDLHFHWVQDAVRSMPKESLLDWLKNHTWPTEAKFADPSYSQECAKFFSQELIKNGTFGGLCYSSIHDHTIDHIHESFIGDYIAGTVIMTINSPDYLTQQADQVAKTVEMRCREFGDRYAVTPRFAPTVDPDTLKLVAASALKTGSFIQTHLSESKEEIDYVLSIFRSFPGFEDVKSYTEIYHRCNLLTEQTIMGHAIHLDDQEWKLLAKTGTSIAHCPTSNAPIEELGLGSGLFSYQKAEEAGVKWGLASDIGAGPHLCMFDVIRSFVEQNSRQGIATSFTKALFRSTVASADIMGLKKRLGSFAPGKWANWLMLSKPNITTDCTSEKLLTEILGNKQHQRNQLWKLIQGRFYRGNLIK
jgi:guanine deaminase